MNWYAVFSLDCNRLRRWRIGRGKYNSPRSNVSTHVLGKGGCFYVCRILLVLTPVASLPRVMADPLSNPWNQPLLFPKYLMQQILPLWFLLISSMLSAVSHWVTVYPSDPLLSHMLLGYDGPCEGFCWEHTPLMSWHLHATFQLSAVIPAIRSLLSSFMSEFVMSSLFPAFCPSSPIHALYYFHLPLYSKLAKINKSISRSLGSGSMIPMDWVSSKELPKHCVYMADLDRWS